MDLSPTEEAALSKVSFPETPTPATGMAAPGRARSCHSRLANAGLVSAGKACGGGDESTMANSSARNKCPLSPPRPRLKTACKPSPARSAAAVILATLLGGQQQPSSDDDTALPCLQAAVEDMANPTSSDISNEGTNGAALGAQPLQQWTDQQQPGAQGATPVVVDREGAGGNAGGVEGPPRAAGQPQRLQWGAREDASVGSPKRESQPPPPPPPSLGGDKGWEARQQGANHHSGGGDEGGGGSGGGGGGSRGAARCGGEGIAAGSPPTFPAAAAAAAAGSPSPAAAGVRRSPRQRSPRKRSHADGDRRCGDSSGEGRARSQLFGAAGGSGNNNTTPRGRDSEAPLPLPPPPPPPAVAGAWTPSPKGVATGGGSVRSMGGPAGSGSGGNGLRETVVTPSVPESGGGGGGLLFCREDLGAAGSGLGDDLGYSSYCRKDKSLGLLCGRFVEVYGHSQHFRDRVAGGGPAAAAAAANAAAEAAVGGKKGDKGDGEEGMIELDKAAAELGVARRRIYDVINILESVCVVTRARKNTYRWHGKKNLILTLRQLQRTATHVFPEEVAKNGMTECLKQAKLIGNAVGSLGGPRADGTKEKSLGGLCRRFVQLFLVGNDVVSVGEAAEKLSEPSDVAGSTVVFKTRARRLYDIANALAALGLVDKVRSRDSCKPNFRWIGVPVRTLPLLDPSQAQQAGTAAGLPHPHTAVAATADNSRLLSPTTTSERCPKSGSRVAPTAPASNAFGFAAGEATGGVVAAAVAAAAAAAAPASPDVGTPGFSSNPLGVGTPTASKGNDVENPGLGTAGGAGDAWAENDLNDMGEVWTPLAAAVAGFGTEIGSESRRSRLRRPSFDGMSPPSTLASTRWVSPSDTPYAAKAEVATDGGTCGSTAKAPTPAAAAAAADGPKAAAAALSSSFVAPEGPSDAMSDQGSPVDPRQVMREFPDPGSYDASSSSSSSTSVERWARKRRRSVPRHDNDDAWLAHQGDGGAGGGEKKKEEDAFSPAQLTAAKSAAVAASKMAEARAAAATTTTTTTTPGRAAAAPPPPPASSGGGGGGRKRARNRSVGVAVAGTTTTTTNAGSCRVGVSTPNTRPGTASASSSSSGSRGGAVARALNAAPPSRARNKDAVGRKQGGARGGGGGGGKAGGEGAMMDGDAEGGAMRWFSLGGGGAAVAVTPEENPLAPPPDPSSVKECLDEYMETYTEQWNSWREGGTGDFRPPTFLSPGLGTAFGSSPTSPTFFASPPPPPAESNSAFSRSSKDWGSDEAGAYGSSAKHEEDRRRGRSSRGVGGREGSGIRAPRNAGGAGTDLAGGGDAAGLAPAMLSSLSSPCPRGGEASDIGREGSWGLGDGGEF